MNLHLQYLINQEPKQKQFLRENSYWYKYLNRNSNHLTEFNNEIKIKYKQTSKDKLDRFTKNIDKVSQLIDIFS